MPNGVLMFRRSGLSIAMGNASEKVQAQASDVTDSYNNEGFAKAAEIGDLLADKLGSLLAGQQTWTQHYAERKR
jgi:hypothetical protein